MFANRRFAKLCAYCWNDLRSFTGHKVQDSEFGTGKVRNSESERREYTQEVDLREPTGLKRDLEHQHAHDSWTGGNGLGGLRARSAARLPDSARSTLVRQPDALRNTCPEVLEGPGSHDGTSDTVSGNCAARQEAARTLTGVGPPPPPPLLPPSPGPRLGPGPTRSGSRGLSGRGAAALDGNYMTEYLGDIFMKELQELQTKTLMHLRQW
ncbi:Sec14-Like Protein 1 [Manis pentadactyla]|nr:Sec14-Like Protein 1 [Manis pentadactyla]